MADTKFSIIIPHYNIPDLLERCLNSIPKRDEIQVIVVDDCSDNHSVSILKNKLELIYTNVQFVYLEKNSGGGKCRNEGLDRAKGKWLLFADSDDFFSENLSLILDKYEFDDSDIIYFRVDCVLSEDVTKHSHERDFNKWRIDEYLSSNEERVLRFLHSEPWGKMIKRDLINTYDIRFSETKVCNDYYFSALSGFHAKKIKADELYLYCVTVREGSVSYSTDSVEKIKTRIQVAASVESYLYNHGYKLEEKYKPEKIDHRMLVLMKRDWRLGINMLFDIHKKGLPILPIIGSMIKIFIKNRLDGLKLIYK